MAQQKRDITFLILNSVKTFITQPTAESYNELCSMQRNNKKEFMELREFIEPYLDKKDTINVLVVKSLLIFSKNQNHAEVTQFLSKALEQHRANVFIWAILGVAIGNGGSSFVDSPPNLQRQFPVEAVSWKSNRLAAYSTCKALSLEDRLAGAWANLGGWLLNGGPFADLALEIRAKFPVRAATLSSFQLAAYCLSKALSLDDSLALTWCNLGRILLKEVLFAALSPEIRTKLFPAQASLLSSAQLAAYCSSKALSLNDSQTIAWSTLAEALLEGAPFADLAPEIRAKFPAQAANQSSALLGVYCYSKALTLDDTLAGTWSVLGITLLKGGATAADLAPELRAKFPAHAANLSSLQLTAYCYSRTLVLGFDENPRCWRALYDLFKRGAKISDVCEQLQEKLIPHIKNDGPVNLELAYFCLQQAQLYNKDPKINFEGELTALQKHLAKQHKGAKRLLEGREPPPAAKRARIELPAPAQGTWLFQPLRQQPAPEPSPDDELVVMMEIDPEPLATLANLAAVKQEPDYESLGF